MALLKHLPVGCDVLKELVFISAIMVALLQNSIFRYPHFQLHKQRIH